MEKYIIQFQDNNSRTFFVNPDIQRTWMKTSALEFDTVEEAEEKIKNDFYLNHLLRHKYYLIINIKEARNH